MVAPLRALLHQIPVTRRWFADYDRLVERARSTREVERRALTGSVGTQDAIRDLLSCFTPCRAVGVPKIRVGRPGDGGYVMLHDFGAITSALSFGISDEVSWDIEIAGHGIDIYQFDHTVEGSPVADPRFHFFRHRIGAVADEAVDSLGSALARITAPMSDHALLKIDIEGSEWEVLDAATPEQLQRFSQIVGEFHGFSGMDDPVWRATAQQVMAKLRDQFEVVHVHGNNYLPPCVVADVAFPEAVEVTFANRALYHFEPTDELFPTPLDHPNCELHLDVYLGNLRFR
jgi:hypothetical protein